MRIIGALLIVVGLIGLIWGGVQWTREEEVVDLGPLEVTHQERESIPIPPIAGGVCLVAGVVLLGLAKRQPAA
jgi:hypothetical protein